MARDCEMVKMHDEIFILETKSSDPNSAPELILQNLGSANSQTSISVDFDFSVCCYVFFFEFFL